MSEITINITHWCFYVNSSGYAAVIATNIEPEPVPVRQRNVDYRKWNNDYTGMRPHFGHTDCGIS